MDLTSTAGLLADVFPGSHVAQREYLEWLYAQSPFGQVIEANLDDDDGRAGHYALVPITLACDGSDRRGALSLNTAVHERARKGGVFVRLAREAMAEARRGGIEAVVGVANANSTPGFLRRLEFQLLTPLPASLMVPTPGPTNGIDSAWSEDSAFRQGGLCADVETMLTVPDSGQARRWTLDTLRWRLARPGARYALHRGEGVVAVSCRDSRQGVGVGMLLKVFSSSEVAPRTRRALVRAVCRFHRTPLALHVGVNEFVRFSGIALPDAMRESPLNLIYRSLSEDSGAPSIVRFEFLDFDAY